VLQLIIFFRFLGVLVGTAKIMNLNHLFRFLWGLMGIAKSMALNKERQPRAATN